MTVCEKYDVKVCLTSVQHRNGTERIGQAAKLLGISNYDIVVDIQGDEPLVDPGTISAVLEATRLTAVEGGDIFLPHLASCPVNNRNVVKVLESNGDVLYLSRADVPYEFSESTMLKKHLSIIGFTGKSLNNFFLLPEGYLEKVEGVELLRALEGEMKIKTKPFEGDSLAVDVSEDLNRVARKMMLCPIARKMCGYD